MTGLVTQQGIEQNERSKIQQIVGGKGGDNGKQIETRSTKAERKTFLNDNAGTSEERKDQTREGNPKKKKTRYRNGKPRNMHQRTKNSHFTQKKERGKESKERNRNVHRTQTPLLHR